MRKSDWQKLEAGEELSALVATHVMGVELKPHPDYALASVGWHYISSTGSVFNVKDPRRENIPWKEGDLKYDIRLAMPGGHTLPDVPGNDNFNARYGLYTAKHLLRRGGEIEEIVQKRVDEYRLTAEKFSEDLGVSWSVMEKMHSEGGSHSLISDDDVHWACVSDGMQPVQECGGALGSYTYVVEEDWRWHTSPMVSICRASLDSVDFGCD